MAVAFSKIVAQIKLVNRGATVSGPFYVLDGLLVIQQTSYQFRENSLKKKRNPDFSESNQYKKNRKEKRGSEREEGREMQREESIPRPVLSVIQISEAVFWFT